MKRIPTALDRYPAKMVSHLAGNLVSRYAKGAESLFDPFSGSCAVLKAAKAQGISRLGGCDINPLSELYASVKIHGFNSGKAETAFGEICSLVKKGREILPMSLPSKDLWFTPSTLRKLETLRWNLSFSLLVDEPERNAILLALALSVRPCSRADQRSPKPFISKNAILTRKGKHFDPLVTMGKTLSGLHRIHGSGDRKVRLSFRVCDNTKSKALTGLGVFSHAITSPPYVNAQDYFRNFKLELHALEGLLPYTVGSIKEEFIGTERGDLSSGFSDDSRLYYKEKFTGIGEVEEKSLRHAKIIYRYCSKMEDAVRNASSVLTSGATFVVVCGDNLVAGVRIPTVEIVSDIIVKAGFSEFDRFDDPIRDRLLPPSRLGHRGIIKNETIIAFKRT